MTPISLGCPAFGPRWLQFRLWNLHISWLAWGFGLLQINCRHLFYMGVQLELDHLYCCVLGLWLTKATPHGNHFDWLQRLWLKRHLRRLGR